VESPQLKKILLVEDEEGLVSIMASVLQDEGFAVKTLFSAEEALQLNGSFAPDLIISDIRMKGIDGFTMFEIMKALERFRNIPFIFLTAIDDRSSQQRALKLGATAYITKPFDVDELLGVVKKALPAS
jgi:DNA-binding response OmpR family regulator